MRMTSLRVQTSAALFLGLLLATSFARADQKDDLYNKGTAAVNSGDTIAAKTAFCALPADFKDAGAQCTTYTDLANKTLNRYKINYSEGMDALSKGDFVLAESKFKNVKAGEYADQAKKQLADIPRLKQQAADAANAANLNAAAEQQSKQKLDSGTNAFNSGDYNSAKSLLGGVSGSHANEAQTILGKIRTYESAISQGNTFMAAHDYSSAKSAYQQAMTINPIGPSNSTDLYTKAVTAAASVTNTGGSPGTTNPVKPSPPKPQIDATAYLDQARKAMAKNQFAKARNLVQEVVRQDRGNQEANSLLTEINANDTTVAVAGADDTQLAGMIRSFYQDSSANSFSDTEDQLKFYIFSKGKTGKTGLANFYLGASILSRYYLTGGSDQNLRRDALSKFKAAKGVDGFKVPDKFVSPKIMKAFDEAS